MAISPAGKGDGAAGKPQLRRFQDLVQKRVRHILLVSNLYDSFILAEDGQLNEALLRQYLDLNLSQNPDLTRVSEGGEALALALAERRFDMILTSLHVGDMDAAELTRRVREAGLTIPVIIIAYTNRALTDFLAVHDATQLDRIFLWQGDFRILIAIVNYVEDRMNVAHDTGVLGVPAVIVVEDNIRFYSSFLPVIYSELMAHSHGLILEGLNLAQKVLRMRARPKILLCTTFEEARDSFNAYREHILGIISDIEYPREGTLDRDAGFALAAHVRSQSPDIPLVLQSSIPENAGRAHACGARFLLKGSPMLLHQLREIMMESFGFGDFVFSSPDGRVLDRAADLKTLIAKLATVPAESIGYHGERNHFSNWLKARTEFELADRLRPRKVGDFRNLEHLREDLIRAISDYRRQRDRVVVADFDRDEFDHRDFEEANSVTRIGGGSLGGKARGLAFTNRLLNESDIAERFPQVQISVPSAVVLGTDVFDHFIQANDLGRFAIASTSDSDTWARFSGAPFPEESVRDLRRFLEGVRYPLAVRSSGLLEDSPSQPFAGVYRTYMLPNNHPDLETRLIQLIAAVKRVYTSTFSRQAKDFLDMTPFRLEEEKMAVIIQKLAGSSHGNRFYPTFSGVARSHNYYPVAPLTTEDGVVAVALGMGRTVVDGSACLRFSPRYPRHQVAFSSVDDVLKNSQREFFALNLDDEPGKSGNEGAELSNYGLRVAEKDGTLAALGSTYSPDNDAISDGISRPGVRLVSFAPILKHGVFPLAELLEALLELGSAGTSSPVEIEFAADLTTLDGRPAFSFLQLRPLTLESELDDVEIGHVLSSRLVCRSSKVLGNGCIGDLRDIVVVHADRFDRLKGVDAAEQIARFNAELQRTGTPYLLIGVGRLGSTDPYLGIPVTWNQIAGARVIVEAGYRDFKVTPSQGTHFFQNLTSCHVGYFTVNPEAGEGYIDWQWLAGQASAGEGPAVRRIRLATPIEVKMSGRTGEGVILKPDGADPSP